MSTFSPLHSHACCTVPPVQHTGYEKKGKFVTIDGLKTYVTGPEDAKKGIFVFYDIFGFYPQTLQGADILAYGDHEQPYRVFIPDLFEGDYAEPEWYPPDTKEKGEKLGGFLSGTAAPPKHLPRVSKLIESFKKDEAKSVSDWATLGYCWGGKMVSLSSGEGTLFKAGAEAHPAMVDAKDAEKISIPILLLPSKDEPSKDVEAFQKALKASGAVESFPEVPHGFMAARGDLENEPGKQAYIKGYKAVLDFFHQHV